MVVYCKNKTINQSCEVYIMSNCQHYYFQVITKDNHCQIDIIMVLWLNTFPDKQVLSVNFSLREVVTRQKTTSINTENQCFGRYCEVYIKPEVYNSIN